jgi:hypothetical protein
MAGDQASGFNEGSAIDPHTGQGPQTNPPQPTGRLRTWPAVVLAAIATVVAVAALIVALTRSPTSTSSSATKAPTYSAAEIAGAQQQLCDAYKLAARAVQTETNGNDKALARIAVSNAAGMLDDAAVNPALDAKHRDAARALATAYRTSNAVGSVATDAEYRAAIDDIIAKDGAMKQVCSGG